jgi:Predicted RNA-binding protein (contains KH domains)
MDEVTDGNVWEIRVPRDRLAVLIGKNGDTKRELEEKAEIALEIDSREGDVTVIQKGDPLKAALSISVIQAIARGFSPQKASFLFEENSQLIVISLREFAKPGSHRISEIKGRIIGTGGKTRKVMEELTNTSISGLW